MEIKNKIFNINLILFFFSFLIIESTYIVIPLKKYAYNENENYMKKYYSNVLYTELSIGEPKQTIIFFVNMTTENNIGIYPYFGDSKFYLNNKNINKDYSYKNSSTFIQVGEGDMTIGTKDILIKEQIKLYTNYDLSEEIKVENVSILYNPNNIGYIIDDVGIDFIIERGKRTTCGYIGLKLLMNSETVNYNLIEQLKEKGIISNTKFSFIEVNKNNEIYKNNNIEYLLVIGEEIHDFFHENGIDEYISEKYDKNKFVEKAKLNDYIGNEGYYFVWKLNIDNIYIYKDNNSIKMEQNQNIFLDNDYGLISGSGEYRKYILEEFFNKYINITKCSQNILRSYETGSFYYYVCDNDININDFPTLYFKSKHYQYIFELTKNDLFIEYNNKLYFLIVFEFSRTLTWNLGQPFLKKYLFSYNYDTKTISFYNENLIEEKKEEEENKNKNKYIILIIVISIFALVSLVLGFLIGKYIYNKNKKRALELDNSLEYDYVNEESQNKDKENKASINI